MIDAEAAPGLCGYESYCVIASGNLALAWSASTLESPFASAFGIDIAEHSPENSPGIYYDEVMIRKIGKKRNSIVI